MFESRNVPATQGTAASTRELEVGGEATRPDKEGKAACRGVSNAVANSAVEFSLAPILEAAPVCVVCTVNATVEPPENRWRLREAQRIAHA